MLNRRQFIKASAFASLGAVTLTSGLGLSNPVRAAKGDRVLIVGGGESGLALAQGLSTSAVGLNVTVLDRHPSAKLARLADLGISVLRGDAEGLDAKAATVSTWQGLTHSYDHLVVAPGVDFLTDGIDGLQGATLNAMPAFWSDRSDEDRFKARVSALPVSGTVVITVPKRPHRFEVGPYQRANDAARQLAATNPGAKVILIDANDSPLMAMAPAVERVQGEILSARGFDLKLETTAGAIQGDLVNLIPAQQAGRFAAENGLVDASGWCPTDPLGRAGKAEHVWVIGDAVKAETDAPALDRARFQADRVRSALAS
ncbi:MAG: twin-arginine translocation signal domain-containing protein [Magnetovibrionaceae bacterium]